MSLPFSSAQVLTFLSSLCVLHGVAIRDKQRHIARHLLHRKGLFLHTSSQQGVVRLEEDQCGGGGGGGGAGCYSC